MSDHDPFDLDQLEERDDLRRAVSNLDAKNEDEDFAWLMSGPNGRRIVRRLLGLSKVFQTSFHPNTMQMSLQEGKKQMGYWLLDQIQRLCPEHYRTMIEESRDARTVASHRSKPNT